jgi:hypothetical protein
MKDDDGSVGQIRFSRAEAKAEPRQQTNEATIDSISRYGPSGTTKGKVAKVAGGWIGLVKVHFESKGRPFKAALKHLADDQRAFWHSRIRGPDRNRQELMQAIVGSQFAPSICSGRTLAVLLASYCDACLRELYLRAASDRRAARPERKFS